MEMRERKSIVGAAKVSGYEEFSAVLEAVRAALAPLGGMQTFVSRGQKVLLKVNLVAPSAPDLAVTTHPSIVKATIRLVHECGGTVLVGDGPGVGDTLTAARTSGIAAVVAEEGAELVPFEETALYENMQNRLLKRIPLTKVLQDIDVRMSGNEYFRQLGENTLCADFTQVTA